MTGLSLLFEQGFIAHRRTSPTPRGAYSDYALIDATLVLRSEPSAVSLSPVDLANDGPDAPSEGAANRCHSSTIRRTKVLAT